MYKPAYYIVNLITIYRVLAAPVLVVLLINRQFELFKWLLAVSFFTDLIDGYLARRFRVTSIAGSRLDSIGDDLTVAVGVAGIFVYNPQFVKEELTWFIILAVLFLLQMALAFYRYGKMSSFHTYMAKAAAILQGVFLILFFFTSEPIMILFYTALIVTAIDLVEEIILIILLPEWKADVKGLYWLLRQRADKKDQHST